MFKFQSSSLNVNNHLIRNIRMYEATFQSTSLEREKKKIDTLYIYILKANMKVDMKINLIVNIKMIIILVINIRRYIEKTSSKSNKS